MDDRGFGADQTEGASDPDPVSSGSAELETHKEDRPYKCSQCDKSYRHAGSLVNHKKTHQVGLYTCLICQKEYSNPMGLKSHLRTHSEEKRFQCEQCGESFRMSQQLYHHRKSLHSFCSMANGENLSSGRKFEVQSPVLVENSSLMSNLENYIAESMVPVDFSQLALKYYPEEKSQDEDTAKEDNEGEGSIAEERDELANSSTEEYRFKCNQCDKVYKHAGSLANHKQSHMVGVYQCAICYKEFSNLMAMKNHCRLHSDSRCRRRLKSPLTPAKNTGTDTPQTDADQTADFMEMHEDPPNISDISENSDRVDDEEKTPIPGPRRRFEFAPKSLSPPSKSNPDVNSETFGLHSALQGCSKNMVMGQEDKTVHDSSSNIKHENGPDTVLQQQYDGTHEEEASSGDLGTRPFRCQECGKTYRHAGSLINHKKTHQTGVYNCSLCSKQMFNMAALKNHLRAHFKSRGGRKMEDAYFHSASFSDFFPSQEDPFQCLVCGKILMNESDFLQHQLLHREDGVKKDYIEDQHREEASESVCWQEHPQVSHGSSDDSAYSSGPGRADAVKTEMENLAPQQWNEGESLAITQETKAGNVGLGLQNTSPVLDQVPQDQIISDKEPCGLQEQSPADRPYKCESCERTYRHKSSLINHKLTHKTGVYQCSLCPKQYTNLMALRNHVRFHSRSHTGRRGLASRRGHNFFRGKPRFLQNKSIHSVVESLNFNGDASTEPATHVATTESLTASPMYCTCGKSFNCSEDFQRHSQRCKNVTSVSCGESPVALQGDNSMLTDPQEAAPKTNLLMDTHGKVLEASEPQGRRVYECDLCEKSYRHSGSLINHKRTHQTGDYMCPYCSKHVHNLAALKNHIRIHHKVRKSQLEGGDNSGLLYSELCFPHDGKDLHGCVSCEEAFHTEGDLLAHQMVHMQLEVEPWDQQAPESSSTPKVNKDTNKELGSIDWERSSISDFHGNETKEVDSAGEDSKPFDYTCVECGEVYSSVEDLTNHKHTHNTGIYQCSFCPKEYSNLLALRSHFQSHTKPQARRNSGRETLDGFEGNDYVDSQPSMDNSYDCGHCGLIFSNEVDFHQHQVAHEKMVMDESLVPEVQESALSFPMHSSERDLLIRIKSEMEEAHQSESADGGSLLSHICGFCGQTYDDLESLQVHSLSHHGAEEEPGASGNFQPESDSEYKPNLQQNLTLKEEEAPGETGKSAENPECRPYTCDQCGKTYRHGGSLVNHKKTHLVGNFQCVACFRQYPNLAAFRNHLRHHPDCKQQALLNNPHALQASYLNDNLYPAADGVCFNFSPPSGITLSEHAEPNLMPSDFKPYADSEFKDNSFLVSAPPQTDFQTPIRRIKNSGRRSSRRVVRRTKSIAIQVSGPGNRSDSGSAKDVEDKSIQVCEFCGTMFFGVKDLAQHLSGNCERNGHCSARGSSSLAGHRTDSKEETGVFQRPFRCEVCSRSYRHAGSLINHKQTHKTGVFRCSICQKRFFNLMAMKNHNRIHFELKRHKCLDCGKAFRLQKQLDTHQRIHRQRAAARKPGRRRSMKYRKAVLWQQQKLSVINVSGERPSKEKSIEKANDIEKTSAPEKKVMDPNVRPYQCEECGRSYRHAGSLFNHKKSHKTGQYCCSVCDKTYNNLMAMKNHQRTHYKAKRHHCPDCEKTFRWKRQLLRHQLVHVQEGEGIESGPQVPSEAEESCVLVGHQEKSFTVSLKSSTGKATAHTSSYEKETYNLSSDFSSVKPVCLACGILFTSYDELESHLCTQKCSDKLSSGNEGAEEAMGSPEEEGRPYQCNICGRSYRHSGSLRNHKNTHETGLYKCSVCQKKFFNFMAIKNHLRIHTAEKRFQCLDCGKAFLSSRELIGHRRVHTGEKPFHCPTCNRGFSRKLNLRHHQRTAHKQMTSLSSQSSSLVLPADKQCENHENNPSKSSEETPNDDDPAPQERKYKCNQCERSYRHAGSLFNHQKTHRTGVYKCPNCLKEFFNLLAFKDHLRIHKYPCKDCGKTFRIASHLAAHSKIHEQEEPLTCPLCNQHFSCHSSFDQHQLTHNRASSDVLEPKTAATFMVEVT